MLLLKVGSNVPSPYSTILHSKLTYVEKIENVPSETHKKFSKIAILAIVETGINSGMF